MSALTVILLVGTVVPFGTSDDDISTATASVVLVAAGRNAGSGFVVDEDIIITSDHVVEGDESEVRFDDGDVAPCRIARRDSNSDLAALRCETDGHPALSIDATTPTVGAPVTAVGYPGGRGPVATEGVVSAVDVGPGFLQTDARVRPGNSGGPLLSSAGEVLGVVAAVDRSQSDAGFAVPAPMIEEFLATVESGDVPRDSSTGTSGSDLPATVAWGTALLVAFAGGWVARAWHSRGRQSQVKVSLRSPPPTPSVDLIGDARPVAIDVSSDLDR